MIGSIFRYSIFNFIILFTFIFGHYFEYNILMIISVSIYWITAMTGTIFYYLDEDKQINIVSHMPKTYQVPQWLSIFFDFITVALMVYFHYAWLTIFYLIYMIGITEQYSIQKNLKNQSKL